MSNLLLDLSNIGLQSRLLQRLRLLVVVDLLSATNSSSDFPGFSAIMESTFEVAFCKGLAISTGTGIIADLVRLNIPVSSEHCADS